MPVYEYQCGACSHQFEEWQKITDPKITVCPKCSKEAVERLISQTAFMLKGGGWYKDLYASSKSGEKSGGSSGESSAASSSNGSSTKSETKSESSSSASSSSASSSSSSTTSSSSSSSGTTAAK